MSCRPLIALVALLSVLSPVAVYAQEFSSMGANEHVPDDSDLTPEVKSEMMRSRGMVRGLTPTSAKTAAEWNALAEQYLKEGKFPEAAKAFEEASRASSIGARGVGAGDASVARGVYSRKAKRYETTLGLYYQRPARRESVGRFNTGKPLEPIYGAYLGAFIDREDAIPESGRYKDENFQTHGEVPIFNRITGVRHASVFMYNSYGKEFPATWFYKLKETNTMAHWALEPNNLDMVRDDEYLTSLAEAARDTGVPIFLRFASEMNGNWTPYHEDIAKYKRKFQLVARVFHKIAPNVAMVWCPNNVPELKIDDYYPGKEAVDWVGVNFYSNYYNNNDKARECWWDDPSNKLDYIYKAYADDHPIMIGEWAASHYSTVDGKDRIEFAVNKMGQLYSALQHRYPRVKAVNWFCVNTIDKYPGKTNNYSLLSDFALTQQYQRVTSSPYFIGTGPNLEEPDMAPVEVAPLTKGTILSGTVNISSYVKVRDVQRPVVAYAVSAGATKLVERKWTPGPYAYTLDTTKLPDGPANIRLDVRDLEGRLAGDISISVMIQNGKGVARNASPVKRPVAQRATPVLAHKARRR